MKNQPCPKGDCMYLHDFGDPEASFTKEQMHLGKHQEYEKKLHDALLNRAVQQTAPASGQSQTSSSASSDKSDKGSNSKQQNGQKDSSWPTLSTSSSTESNSKSGESQSIF